MLLFHNNIFNWTNFIVEISLSLLIFEIVTLLYKICLWKKELIFVKY